MSSISSSEPLLKKQRLVSTETNLNPKAHWITPKEQLERLGLPIEKEVSRVFTLIPTLAKIIAKYATDEPLTHWYTALRQLTLLPKKIPPLPDDIHEILNSNCPIYCDQLKEDKTFYKIKDTHFLSLVSKEFDNLTQLESKLKKYGDDKYPKGKNPLQFRYFWHVSQQEYTNVPFLNTHWILLTNTVVPKSGSMSWTQQVDLVKALSEKALVNYKIPKLQQIFAAITTDMVATGKVRYQIKNYTRVKETSRGRHLMVGGSNSSGVRIVCDSDYNFKCLGVAALREF